MDPSGEKQTRHLPFHSQASSPHTVTPAQLPSPRTLPIGAVIWYTDLLEAPKIVQGTYTPQIHAHDGRTQTVAHGAAGRAVSEINVVRRGPVNGAVLSREAAMMTSQDLHPLARDVLEAFAAKSYFRSLRLANALAERNPTQCVRWAFNLAEPLVNASTPHEVVTRTLLAIRDAITSPSANRLSQLDLLSWESWCSGSFDEASPFAQRAVARLGWATMLLIGQTTGTHFESKCTGIHVSANADGAIREMANQCGMAVDMIYTDTYDGRLMVAASFSREMAAAS